MMVVFSKASSARFGDWPPRHQYCLHHGWLVVLAVLAVAAGTCCCGGRMALAVRLFPVGPPEER